MASQPDIQAHVSVPVRVARWAFPLVTLASLLLGATSIVRGTRAVVSVTDSDLTNFFFKSAEYILRGDPWHIYAVRASGAYPNYNPPLSIFLMAPLLKLAQAIGFAANYGEQITFVSLPFILLVPLLGYLVLRALRAIYPEISGTQQLLAYMLVTLSPLTWQTYNTWFHVEQPLMLCFLIGSVLALQRRQEWLAGALAALAVLTRTTAIMPFVGIGVLLLAGREWRGLIRFAIPAVGITLLGLAPFFLVYPTDTKYSLLTWRGGAPIGSNSIWAVFAYGGTASSLRHLLDAGARRLDEYTVLLFIVVVAALAARRLRASAYRPEAWAVITLAMLSVPMLSKTVWPYYYLEPFIALLVWEFGTMHDRRAGVWRWPVLSVGFLCAAATLSQYIGLKSVGTLDRISVGIVQFGVMVAFAVAIWARARAKKDDGLAATYGSQAVGTPLYQPSGAMSGAAPAPASAPASQAGARQWPAAAGLQHGFPPASSRFGNQRAPEAWAPGEAAPYPPMEYNGRAEGSPPRPAYAPGSDPRGARAMPPGSMPPGSGQGQPAERERQAGYPRQPGWPEGGQEQWPQR